jgi:riboflavin synthase
VVTQVFTGLVAGMGTVEGVVRSTDGVRLTVTTDLAGELGEGDSVAVNGVCLTATEIRGRLFAADVMNETLARTSLRDAGPGAQVNL